MSYRETRNPDSGTGKDLTYTIKSTLANSISQEQARNASSQAPPQEDTIWPLEKEAGSWA